MEEWPKPKITEEQMLDYCVQMSKMYLYERYGIELTNTEYLYLRDIAKESIARQDDTRAKSSTWSMDRFYAENDIPLLFIQKMYDIPDTAIPKMWAVSSIGPGSEDFEFNNKMEAKHKKEELQKQGKGVWLREKMVATDDFKKYLKRMREAKKLEE